MGGLLGAGAAAGAIAPDAVFGPMSEYHISNFGLLIGGVLVGVGTRLGSGCTSGHGVCGLARLSPRSAAAVASFMATGFASAWGAQHIEALRPLLRGGSVPEQDPEWQAVQGLLQDEAAAAAAVGRGGQGLGEGEGAAMVQEALASSVQYSPSLAQVPLGVAAPAAVGAMSAWLAYLAHRDARAMLNGSVADAGTGGGTGEEAQRREGEASGQDSSPARTRREWMRRRAFADTAVSYGLGLAFGGGLIVSGMANPVKVMSFLDVMHPGGWDPSLAFVMGGAAGVSLPVFQGVLREQRAWEDAQRAGEAD